MRHRHRAPFKANGAINTTVPKYTSSLINVAEILSSEKPHPIRITRHRAALVTSKKHLTFDMCRKSSRNNLVTLQCAFVTKNVVNGWASASKIKIGTRGSI